MYIALRSLLFSVILLCLHIGSDAQTIVLADGSALPRYFCFDSAEYELKIEPAIDGSFDGCGVYERAGKWYFSPPVASAQRPSTDRSIFPFSCALTFTETASGRHVSRNITVAKPVVINPPLEDLTTCDGHFSLLATTLYAGAYEYKWTPASFLTNPDTSVTDGYIENTTTFVIEATDQQFASQNFFCKGSDTVTVIRHPVPDLEVSNDTLIDARERVQLLASGAMLYQWFPSKWLDNHVIPNPIASPHGAVTYMVVGTNEFGCTDTAYVFIDVNEELFIPNAFSPNGDGINDVFRIENIGYQSLTEFRVFNRNGQEVWHTANGIKGWDGSHKGQPAEVGTYFYTIRLEMPDGEAKLFKGDVTLLR